MKLRFLCLLCFVICLSVYSNEYTDLLKQQTSLSEEISEIERKIKNPNFWDKLLSSPQKEKNYENKLNILRKDLKGTKEKIREIQSSTVVYFNRIDLLSLPDFDTEPWNKANADVQVLLNGKEIWHKHNCNNDISVFLDREYLIECDSLLTFRDEDIVDWQPMGQVLLSPIIEQALCSDASTGKYTVTVSSSSGSYTCIIYYRKSER